MLRLPIKLELHGYEIKKVIEDFTGIKFARLTLMITPGLMEIVQQSLN